MQKIIQVHFNKVLSHLYINPLEKCNLRCKICYTKKTSPVLTEKEILEFIDRYRQVHPLEVITFCGGEVFTLPYFTGMVNRLTDSRHSERSVAESRNPDLIGIPPLSASWRIGRDDNKKSIFIQIITNGTVDRLEEIDNPNMVNLIVSIDGMKEYHDRNRGEGNFEKSVNFLKKAIKLGFHTEIFTIVTRQNYGQIEEFEYFLIKESGFNIPITYHPRKPMAFLLHHPISNIEGIVEGFDYLSDKQMREIMDKRKTFPPKELGCYQIALVSDGSVYGCCEGTVPLGKMGDKIEMLFKKLEERLERSCLACSQPDFVCGLQCVIARTGGTKQSHYNRRNNYW